ncbi:MAG: NADH-quinone oxidoreductase subunit D [Candidatus Hodarchaeales archaeon]|jgi:NADH-quinone oxidoreductase subunit D
MTQMTLNMGPQHPMLHGLWSFQLKIDAEKVHAADVKLGYIHKGVEKIAETRTYDGFIPLADRGICYASAFSWGTVYTSAVERLWGIEDEIPERAEWIRVLLSEANRIQSHLMWISAWIADLGNWTGMMLGFRDREFFLDLLESASGSRMNYNYSRIGGVARDLPEGFRDRAYEACDWMEWSFSQWEGLLDNSDVFLLRTKNVGVMSKDTALEWGVTGPNMRATGWEYDIRKVDRYWMYDKVKFRVPTGDNGDTFDRYIVRMEEIKESVKIIRQCLDQMPEGPVNMPKIPRKPVLKEAYYRLEDPRGESGIYLVDDVDNKSRNPYRLKIKSPAFVHFATFPLLSVGGQIADLVAVLGSMDLCMGETDR